jgi:mRNA-degrading endonuclease toxin of MazEF toxin-antitoxin module
MRISVAGLAIRRGEIWWTVFDDTVGGEIRKSRPAVIVSNDDSNAILNRVQVLPVTSRVRRVYPSEALIRIDGKPNKANGRSNRDSGQEAYLKAHRPRY